MTRAASGAQRSGAAALIIILRDRCEYFAPCHEHFATSYFFAPRAPARCRQRKIEASWLQPAPPGSVVLVGSGDRTAKHLKSIGSAVLFWSLTRDARADMRPYMRKGDIQNHRTIELDHKSYVSVEVSGSLAVLWFRKAVYLHLGAPTKGSILNRLPVLAANKQWGGYCLNAFAAQGRPDQGLFGRAARRNFRGWARLAVRSITAIAADGGLIEAPRGNGGFLPFFGGAQGRVGFASLDRCGFAHAFQGVAAARIQPAGLAATLAEGPGGRLAAEGGTPPTGLSISLRPQAQPIFGVSSRFEIRRDAASTVLDLVGRKLTMPETGSGVSDFRCRLAGWRHRAQSIGCQVRVGENGISLGRGRSRDLTLWGELASVN
ncbi:MAG: hypothetical protein P0Y64_02015 [Candidatus Sphingomonas colombiensis]|nr:hypothetical protein [Sphingomonas sp.]WEK43631.1 MAG: hypothetical protein P0Y64_02015 [Sphingomonas sp.]